MDSFRIYLLITARRVHIQHTVVGIIWIGKRIEAAKTKTHTIWCCFLKYCRITAVGLPKFKVTVCQTFHERSCSHFKNGRGLIGKNFGLLVHNVAWNCLRCLQIIKNRKYQKEYVLGHFGSQGKSKARKLWARTGIIFKNCQKSTLPN